jgi:DNA-binding NarL/FixJ family response regulator
MLRFQIVEDNSVFRLFLSSLIRNIWQDAIIDQADDTVGVAELVGKLNPNIIFTDIDLPSANGLDLTKAIKSAFPDIPVVIISSHDGQEYLAAAKAAGASGYLQKDQVNPQMIASIVSALVAV